MPHNQQRKAVPASDTRAGMGSTRKRVTPNYAWEKYAGVKLQNCLTLAELSSFGVRKAPPLSPQPTSNGFAVAAAAATGEW